MAKFILMQAVQVLLSVMVIFGSYQKKSGENVFIIQCIVRFSFSCGFYAINWILCVAFILNSERPG